MYGNKPRFQPGDRVYVGVPGRRIPGQVIAVRPNGTYMVGVAGRGAKQVQEQHMIPRRKDQTQDIPGR